MEILETLITTGRIVDIMLAVMALEVVAVTLYRRSRGGGIAFWPLILNIGAGGSLMLALRASLTDAGYLAVSAFLIFALIFHVADQVGRWDGSVRR